MARTLVAVFEDRASAQAAMRELTAAGVPAAHIREVTTEETAAAGTEARAGDATWTERVADWFGALFEDDEDRAQASHYAEAWRRGHPVVVADVEARLVGRAVDILNRHGTVDLNRRVEDWRAAGYTGRFDRTAKPFTAEERRTEMASRPLTEKQTEAVVQEELSVGKRVVQRGGVRVHSYVEERPVEEVVRLREEKIRVQRRPVDRPATAAEASFQDKDRTIEVKATAEEPVVEKKARVVEEVTVGKEVKERDQTVKETVRKKDVKVEGPRAPKPPPTHPESRR